ncbi:MAG: DUF2934 domain-containing protein [Candidatus Sulfotelmatobacter sp.]
MARAKSTTGGKSNRSKQTIGNDAAGLPDVPRASATETAAGQIEPETRSTPEVKSASEQIAPEMKSAPEPKNAPEMKTTPEPKNAPEMKITPEPKKFELHKTESRKNVFPINLEDEIRRRAYELFQQRGVGSGSEAEDWLSAEREVMQRYRQHSA